MTSRILLLALCLGGCVSSSPPPSSVTGLPPPLASYDDRVEPLLARMTLDEKIGQMTQVDQQYLVREEDIETFFLGSLLNGGDSDPAENSFQEWTRMYNRYQSRALRTRLGIPLLYGVDAVHGHANVVGAVVFPHNVGLGASRNPHLVREVYQAAAREVRATGINWSFAPSVSVCRDDRWGRAYEAFGEEPGLVAVLGAAAVEGLQGAGLGDPAAVLACAKHCAGDGGTLFGTGPVRRPDSDRCWPLDRGDTRVDENTFRKLHLLPYQAAIRSGAGSIMVSFSSWNGVPCSVNRRLLTEILKGELDFQGFLVSDWGALQELPGDYKENVRQAIDAGLDMVMVPDRYREFIGTLKELVQEGKVSPARIDDAVRRILRVKFALGLLDPGRSPLADPMLAPTFGSAEHRELARKAVRQSLVLLRNENSTLPLPRDLPRIHVAGKNAHDLGHQCGGWTVRWQGGSGPITRGTTILEALRQAVSPATRVSYSPDGRTDRRVEVAVAVIGETPYAEMFGDREDLALDPEDIQVVRQLRRQAERVVVILISGRPLEVEPILEHSDAVIAVWLPGSEGQGVADVLFGFYPPTGKLPVSWPRSGARLPVNVGDPDYDPLFEYGFGLTY